MAMRKVSIHLDLEKLPKNNVEVSKAVGYLSMWAFPEKEGAPYDTVEIYNDGRNDLIAYFGSTVNKEYTYTMGAVWRSSGTQGQYGTEEGEFTFHT